jgi:UDP-N-acetylmuramoyl-tripeptide--D-alanyl-D-alanine ligase
VRSRTLEWIADAIDGEAVRPEGAPAGSIRSSGASIDSRRLTPGDLFFAIRAERDGHDFAEAAVEAGASAVVVARDATVPTHLPRIVVEDPRAALGLLAGRVRREEACDLPAVAVTGSVGKTTLCSALAHLCAPLGVVHHPRSSFNNDLGLPLTILSAPEACSLLVLEIGTNSPGEIAALTPIAGAAVGVITAIAPVHLEGLGDLDGVRREKGALLQGLIPDAGGSPPTGWIPVGEADAIPEGGTRRRTFGPGGDSSISVGEDGLPRWRFRGEVHTVEGAPTAPHRLDSLAVALAVAAEWGLEPSTLLGRVPTIPQPRLRGEVLKVAGLELILDCYNASPASMVAAIEELEREPAAGRRCCVLGTMEELGPAAEVYHRELGRRLADSTIDRVFVQGEGGAWIAEGMREAGAEAQAIPEGEAAAPTLALHLDAGDRILLKASRSARLELLADALFEILAGGKELA